MTLFSNTNRMVNRDGSVYHIGLKPGELADTVIVPGDMQRVHDIASFFDSIEHRASNREFVGITGHYHGKRITVLSTGIGTDNCDIVMHELDTLANVNLATQERNEQHRSLSVIRIGTSGSIQPDIPVGSFCLSSYAAGLDNLLYFYADAGKVIDQPLSDALTCHTGWLPALSKPYVVKGSERLTRLFEPHTFSGITVTAPGFYGPQGRLTALPLAMPDMIDTLRSFRSGELRINNFEMESSALYGLGAMMHHDMITVCAIIANRITGTYDPDHKSTVKNLVGMVLELITGNH
jgi:uridine phosphorylase